MTRVGRIARDLLLVALVVFAFRWFQTREAPREEAPALVGPNLDGALVSLEGFRGEPVVVYFWASWCGVCGAMAGSVDALAERANVIRVAVRSGTAEQVAAALGSEVAGRAHVIVDPAGRLASSWGVGAFPTLFWIDGDGEIRFVEVGYTSSFGLRARTFFTN